MGGRGREGEPIEWTGWVPDRKCAIQEKPDRTEHDRRDERAQACGSHWRPGRQEKPLARTQLRPYRTPTQVGRGNSPKVNERSSVKELGKLTPYLRKKGCLSSFSCESQRGEQAAGNWLKRLFTKNTGLCERVSGHIGADSCPVPEGETKR
jgi:hypothetical protein